MKKSSESVQRKFVQEVLSEKELSNIQGKSKTHLRSLHIQKVQPAETTAVVADPGGCRPTGN